MRPESEPIPRSDGGAPGDQTVPQRKETRAPWSAWPGLFLAFLRAEPRWLWVPLAIVSLLLLLLIAFGPDVDARFDYTLF